MESFKYDLIMLTGGTKGYAPVKVAEECHRSNKKFVAIKYKDISIVFKKDTYELRFRNQKMPTSRSIFLRGLGEDPIYNPFKLAIINWFKQNGSKVLNINSFLNWPSLDKTTQHIIMVNNNIPIVDTYAFGSKENLHHYLKAYPFIAKDVIGSCGINVYKIKGDNDLKKLYKTYDDVIKMKGLIFQKFLTGGEDLRVIVIGGKIIGAMKRIAKKGEYLTNYSQGGSVENYDIDKDKSAKEIALKVAKTFKLDYCGVDLMKNEKGQWVVLEVNRACQFKGFELATGINVGKKIVDFMTR